MKSMKMDELMIKINKMSLIDIDEREELSKYYKMFEFPVKIELDECKKIVNESIIRYLRYIKHIDNWMEFIEVRECIKRFLYEKDILIKVELMIYIDRCLYQIIKE